MKLGVFTVSVPEWDPIQTLEKLSAMGYDGVEWRTVKDMGAPTPGFWRGNRCSLSAQDLIDRADELKAKAKQCKLEMPSLASYIETYDLAAVELHMQAANAIGAKSIRVGPGGYDPKVGGYKQLVEKAKKSYPAVIKLAEKYKVRCVCEIHPGTLHPSMATAVGILGEFDPKYVGIVWDPANQVCEGLEEYRMALEIAGPYLHEVHVKNNWYLLSGRDASMQAKWYTQCCPLWEGIADWPAIIETLRQAGYDGWFHVEDFSNQMPLEERTRKNCEFIKPLLKARS